MAVVKLAEASQTHTAAKEYFKNMKMHPNAAAAHCNNVLTQLGLSPVNADQMDVGREQFVDLEIPDTPLMSGLFEAAISGNYGPLQTSASAPPVPPAFGAMPDGFSDNEGDDSVINAMGATDLQAGATQSI